VLLDPAVGEAGDIDPAVVTLRFADGCLGTIGNILKGKEENAVEKRKIDS
jgi:hypothetical protein